MKGKRPNITALNAAQALAQLETTTLDLRGLLVRQTVNALPEPHKQILASTLDSPTESVDVTVMLRCEQNYAGTLLSELHGLGLLARTPRVENGTRCYVYTLTPIGQLVASALSGKEYVE